MISVREGSRKTSQTSFSEISGQPFAPPTAEQALSESICFFGVAQKESGNEWPRAESTGEKVNGKDRKNKCLLR